MMRIATAWLYCAAVMAAAEWGQFRGPGSAGVAEDGKLPEKWSSTENVVWKTEVPGEGWSSPVIYGDRVFLTSVMDNGTSCRILCLDRKSGQILWNKEVFTQVPRRKERKNSYATPTPTTDGQRVYAVFGDGSFASVDYEGKVIWTNRDFPFYSRHGLGASPLLHGDLLIMPFDWSNPVATPGVYPQVTDEERLGWQLPWDKSFLVALDKNTGKLHWKTMRGMSRIAHVTPNIMLVEGREQLITSAGDIIQGLDPKTGEKIWNIYSRGEGVTPSLVVGDGLVYTSSGFEKSTIRVVRPTGRSDVTATHIAWEQTRGTPNQASPLYVAPHLFAVTDGGIASCYKGDSGEIVWQERIGGNYSASPICSEGRIYFLSEAGDSVVVAAGPEFKILARNSIEEKCQASYAVSQKQIFIRSEKNLFCISGTR